MYKNIPVLDCHVHDAVQTDIKYLAGFLEGTGTERACLHACSHSRCLSTVPHTLVAKKCFPDKFYVFAAPDVSAYYLHADDLGEHMALYGQQLLTMGCDGIKILESKPQMRKMHPIPDFDDPVWEPFWAWAEKAQVPFLWHVNDPETFWDAENAPEFAISQGWLYDESYVNNEVQYTQILNVLDRHPNMRIIFAHFFFMSAQLDRLSAVLDKYPNVMVDITPGIEMYENFSKNIEKTAVFFEKYSKRICYGTDIGGRCVLMGEGRKFDPLENTRRPQLVRYFLGEKDSIEISSDGHFLRNNPPFIMHPLGLDRGTLADILMNNFIRQVGGEPKKVKAEAVLAECERVLNAMNALEIVLPGFEPDCSVIESCEKIFG